MLLAQYFMTENSQPRFPHTFLSYFTFLSYCAKLFLISLKNLFLSYFYLPVMF